MGSETSVQNNFHTIFDTANICKEVCILERSMGSLLIKLSQVNSSEIINDKSLILASKWALLLFEDSNNWFNLIPISVPDIKRDNLNNFYKENSSLVNNETISQLVSKIDTTSEIFSKIDLIADDSPLNLDAELLSESMEPRSAPKLSIDAKQGSSSRSHLAMSAHEPLIDLFSELLSLSKAVKDFLEQLLAELDPCSERHLKDTIEVTLFKFNKMIAELIPESDDR